MKYVSNQSLPVSKKMTTSLRHSPILRLPDGAIHWQAMLDHFEGFDTTMRTGRDAYKTDQTRSGSSTASTTWAICSTCEPFKGTSVEQNWTQSCNVTSKLHMDGQTFCIILDLLLITGLSCKEVLSREESSVKREDMLSSVQL